MFSGLWFALSINGLVLFGNLGLQKILHYCVGNYNQPCDLNRILFECKDCLNSVSNYSSGKLLL